MLKPGPHGVTIWENQWFRKIEWSPVLVGDLQLSIPEIFNFRDFGVTADRPGKLLLGHVSYVFSSFTYDPEKSEFELLVNEKVSPTATPKLYKQLCISLGDPATKELDKPPKRVTWNKDAKWSDGAAAFKFILTEPAGKEPASVVIIVTREK